MTREKRTTPSGTSADPSREKRTTHCGESADPSTDFRTQRGEERRGGVREERECGGGGGVHSNLSAEGGRTPYLDGSPLAPDFIAGRDAIFEVLTEFGMWLTDPGRRNRVSEDLVVARIKKARSTAAIKLGQDDSVDRPVTAEDVELICTFVEYQAEHHPAKTGARLALILDGGDVNGTHQAAERWAAANKQADHDHGETIRKDNQESWEDSLPVRREQMMAMHLYDLIVGQRHGSVSACARRLVPDFRLLAPPNDERVAALIRIGSAIYCPLKFANTPINDAWPLVAEHFLTRGMVAEWLLWTERASGHTFVRKKNRERFVKALESMPAELRELVDAGDLDSPGNYREGDPMRLGFCR